MEGIFRKVNWWPLKEDSGKEFPKFGLLRGIIMTNHLSWIEFYYLKSDLVSRRPLMRIICS